MADPPIVLNAPAESYAEAVSREYPEPCAQPCAECPWRRVAAPGWLGPMDADEWLEVAHGEAAVACHMTIPDGGGWGVRTLQCAGAATFRANVCKLPHNPTIATGPVDADAVFASNAEFKAHHEGGQL